MFVVKDAVHIMAPMERCFLLSTSLALVERERTELFGSVTTRGRRRFLRVDRIVANTDWPFVEGSAEGIEDGAFVVAAPPEGAPLKVGPVAHLAPDLSCPLLGLFGAEDQYPSPAEVAELEKILADNGKTFSFHSYEGAGHAFFATNRPSYRPEAANEGWARIWEFFDRYLSA